MTAPVVNEHAAPGQNHSLDMISLLVPVSNMDATGFQAIFSARISDRLDFWLTDTNRSGESDVLA